MNKFFTTLLTLAALAIAIPAGTAEHCESWTTADPEVDVEGTLYVDNDNDPRFLFSIWVYLESNGIPGLQRGDEVVDNTCHKQIESDTILF